MLVSEMLWRMADLAIAAKKALRPSGRIGQATMIACRSASSRRESGKSVPDGVPRSGEMCSFSGDSCESSSPLGGTSWPRLSGFLFSALRQKLRSIRGCLAIAAQVVQSAESRCVVGI